ncbi:MAG: hypothetical protein JWQ25_3155 [Daejeonella sp.]|nr:hypothetical protein [Daejeonella sp.]
MPQLVSTPSRGKTATSAANDKRSLSSDESLKPIESSSPLKIQTKLTVGSPNDPLEHEADSVAEQVVRTPENSFIQRKCDECEKEEKLQKKPLADSVKPTIQAKGDSPATASESTTTAIQSGAGKGSTLDQHTNSFMSSRFGNDFSAVKIHTDSEAVQLNRDLNAKAFTTGSDIYFNEGQYQPHSTDGKKLLAHELTHVVQQENGMIRRCVNPAKNDPLYDGLITRIKATPAYGALVDKTEADKIIVDAKQKPACLYYAGKLKDLFDTPEKPAGDVVAENTAVTVEAVKEEKARVAKPEAVKDLDMEKKAADAVPAANWKKMAGKFGGGTYEVDNSNPLNIVVRAKVFLKPTGSGTADDVKNIKLMHDGIEKAASTKGFIVSITFIDAYEPESFTTNVHQEGWTTANNWSAGSPTTLAHELLHMLAFPIDRYNYIESHAKNQSMLVKDRLHWFAVQLTKPPGFDNPLSIMGSGEHPLDDDACRVAGLDIDKCVAARRRGKP